MNAKKGLFPVQELIGKPVGFPSHLFPSLLPHSLLPHSLQTSLLEEGVGWTQRRGKVQRGGVDLGPGKGKEQGTRILAVMCGLSKTLPSDQSSGLLTV